MKRSARADSDPEGTRFREGVDLFNRGEFWKAHEAWEAVWLTREGEPRQFLQGLIQIAAACYHIERDNLRGAVRLRDAAMRRLEPLPAFYDGIDLEQLRRDVGDLVSDETESKRQLPTIRILEG